MRESPMTRTRTFRLVSIAVAVAFLLTLAGVPGAVGAAPAARLKGRSQPAAARASRVARASGTEKTALVSTLRSRAHGLAASGLQAAVVSDDDIPGVDATLPMTVSDTLDSTAYDPVDADDVYRVYLQKGERLVATLTVDPDAWVSVDLFGPAAASIWAEDTDPVARASRDLQGGHVLMYVAPAAGYYYLDVWALPKVDPIRQIGFPGYDGWAGPYTLGAATYAATADDNIPGVDATLPISGLTGTLAAPADIDDVYRVWVNAGDTLIASLTVDSDFPWDPSILIYGPEASDLTTDPIDGWYQKVGVRAMVSGYYYIDVNSESWTGTYTLDAQAVAPAADDNIPGVDKTLPISGLTGTLDSSADPDDVYRVWANAGDTLMATLAAGFADPEHPDPSIYLFGPGATNVDEDDPLAGSGEQHVSYVVPVSGYYYIDVYAEDWAGTYTLDAVAAPLVQATSVTIRTNATSAKTGNIPILSGAVTPIGMVGRNMVVYVMKPGKTYWTYSSNRTVYNLGGTAAWQYKYYFKAGMVKGYYKFKAVVPAYFGLFLTSTSPTTVGITLR
jgi:Bacterial pre-peptidase C-terminal domain